MNLSDREQRIQTICLLVLSTVSVAAALYWLSSILVPFVLALFFSLGLAPLVEFQTRVLHFPKGLAVFSTIALTGIVMLMIGALISSSLQELSANSAAYQEQISSVIERARAALPLERLGLPGTNTKFDPLSVIPTKSVGQLLVRTTNVFLDLLSQGFIVMIFTFFLLAGGSAGGGNHFGMREEIEVRIKGYIVTQTLISAATGILVWLVLAYIGVDLALVFGLFTFLLNFIPSIGSVIAVLLPLPVVLMSPDITTAQAVVAIAVPGTLQFVIGNFITPKVMGDALDLHPVGILLALMFWGTLWGIVGMFLAIPITAILKILMERFDLTEPLARALAASPAVSPAAESGKAQ